MTYKQMLHNEMIKLAANPKVRFIGYNTKCGHQMYGTLKGLEDWCIETPVAENLMCGIAMGLALEGFLPVLCFERMDFCLAAADALVNHAGALQHYGLVLPMIIRVCVGTDKPLDPGVQHRQIYARFFAEDTHIKTYTLPDVKSIQKGYEHGRRWKHPIMLVEAKEYYETDYIT